MVKRGHFGPFRKMLLQIFVSLETLVFVIIESFILFFIGGLGTFLRKIY